MKFPVWCRETSKQIKTYVKWQKKLQRKINQSKKTKGSNFI